MIRDPSTTHGGLAGIIERAQLQPTQQPFPPAPQSHKTHRPRSACLALAPCNPQTCLPVECPADTPHAWCHAPLAPKSLAPHIQGDTHGSRVMISPWTTSEALFMPSLSARASPWPTPTARWRPTSTRPRCRLSQMTETQRHKQTPKVGPVVGEKE